MVESSGSSNLLQVLRGEFLPYLQNCRNPDQLPELLERLAGYLGADGAILWSGEDDRLTPLATLGCVDNDWAVARAAESAGATAFLGGAAVLTQAQQGPYRPEISGHRLAQVVSFPLQGPKGRVGCVEFWWTADGRKPAPVNEILPLLEDALNQTVPALLEYEAERRNYVNAISRLMMLYDIGKVFHSTLDLNELGLLISSRVQNILEAEGAAVWMLHPVKKNLYCAAAGGPNSAAFEQMRIWASDPGLGTAVSQGETVLLHDVEDPEWTGRWGSPIHSLAAVPLLHGGKFLGAIEAVRGSSAPRFSEEDLRLLIDVAKQAAVALRNAQRLQLERRVNELNALMEISKEITATLDLDRVLATTVNRITSVLPADRCSVSLFRRGEWEVSAMSGEMKVDRKSPAVRELEGIHLWIAGSGGDIAVTQTDAGIDSDREETREKFARYFQQAGMRALTGLLLRDEEGPVGVLVLESKDAESLTPSHNDLARIFASQVTVAVRNALLYQRVPLVGILQPLMTRKEKFIALPSVRRNLILAAAAAILLFLIFFPYESKPSGEARVLPARVRPVSAEVEGVVRRVAVGEGQPVQAGQFLAELAPDHHRAAFEQAQAEYDILSRRVLQFEAAGDLGATRIERARLQQAAAQLDLDRTRLARTELRSPISGVVITPRLEERLGQFLRPGDVFCQVVEIDRAWVELAVSERDVGEILPGQQAWVKLNTFPASKFVGHVVRVSPQARDLNQERVFDVIVEVPNTDPQHLLRAGMMGRGKVLAGRRSIGYLILRVPARWLWLKIWNWLP